MALVASSLAIRRRKANRGDNTAGETIIAGQIGESFEAGERALYVREGVGRLGHFVAEGSAARYAPVQRAESPQRV